MQTIVNVQVRDQALQVNAPKLSSGGVNEIKMVFSFCPLWDGFVKTAVFYRDPETVYHVLITGDNTCIVPHEVTDDAGAFYFGVFGTKDDVVRTTEVLALNLLQGPPLEGTTPEEPTPDIYRQLLTELDNVGEQAQAAEAAANAAKTAAATAQSTANAAVAKSWSLADGKSIAANTDLHTITEIGNYYCYTSSTAATLKNCPINSAFTLKIECSTGVGYNSTNQHQYRRAELRPYGVTSGLVYFASANTSDFGATWTWSDWHKVADAADFLPLTGGTITGHVNITPGTNANLLLEDGSRYTIKTTAAGNFGVYEYGSDSAWVRTIVEVDRNGNVTNGLLASKTAVETAQTTAATAQSTADAAMPKAGGTFTGDAVAYSTNRTNGGLRNIEVRATSATGTLQSTNKIIMVRK